MKRYGVQIVCEQPPAPWLLRSRPKRAEQMIEKRTLWAMAVASGLAVANNYYAQPLLADMGSYFAVPDRRMGLVSMLSQVGFATGMLLFVPLGDRLERRSFILGMLGAVTVALLGVAAAPNFVWLAAPAWRSGSPRSRRNCSSRLPPTWLNPPNGGEWWGRS